MKITELEPRGRRRGERRGEARSERLTSLLIRWTWLGSTRNPTTTPTSKPFQPIYLSEIRRVSFSSWKYCSVINQSQSQTIICFAGTWHHRCANAFVSVLTDSWNWLSSNYLENVYVTRQSDRVSCGEYEQFAYRKTVGKGNLVAILEANGNFLHLFSPQGFSRGVFAYSKIRNLALWLIVKLCV